LPAIYIDESVKEYTDASTNTDPMATAGSSILPEDPPAYTAKSDSISHQAIMNQAHPRDRAVVPDADVEDEYEGLVDGLGVRCNVIEEEIRLRKEARSKLGPGKHANSSWLTPVIPVTRSRQWSARRDKRGIVDYIIHTGGAVHSNVGTVGVCVGMFAGEY
jgi:hypothetical protein